MRKKKWKKILIWSGLVIVILGVGGLFAANYAVDKLISTLAADLENDLLNLEAAGTDNQSDKQDQAENVVPSTTPTDTEETTTVPDGEKDLTEKEDTNTTTDISSNEPEKPNNSTDSYNAEVSVDKAKNLQEKISVSEKAQVSSVLLKELSVSDIKEIQALASGGLSVEEKKQARSIILEKLSAEQYDELIQVAKKYGMSQGKSYEEVVKEK